MCERTSAKRRGFGALAVTASAFALAACGGDKTFTAEEFIEEVNAEGVNLQLGDPLVTSEEDKELYEVELESLAALPGEKAGHAGGSLSVYEEAGDADQEMETCAAAADLLCYRASNVVVVLEGGGIEAQQLGVAIERLRED